MDGFWYKVESGDSLSSIAQRFGVSGYKKIWNHPKNKTLKKRRKDEHHIYPGDRFWIPNSKPNTTSSRTGTKTKLEARTVKISIISVTFRTDHVDGAGQKILRPTPGPGPYTGAVGRFKGADDRFTKPEWDVTRGGNADSHPISHTKGQHIEIDVEFNVKVTPKGSSAKLTQIHGKSSEKYLSFEDKKERVISTQQLTVKGLRSKESLPGYVTLIKNETIDWTVDFENRPSRDIGATGPHTIYVTLDTPGGMMESNTPNFFKQTGSVQDVTEERLKYSVRAASGTGTSDEKECVDAIFRHLDSIGVGYSLGKRWVPGSVNKTGITPKPTLHHYLWLCNASKAEGECHNIAAAFILACRILGVKGTFEVGYMYPWPSRKNNHPTYPKSRRKTASGKSVMGKYNDQYKRSHQYDTHGSEKLCFVDANGGVNNFEGVANYEDGKNLYAIGEDIFDQFSDAHTNASSFYADRKKNGDIDWSKGWPYLRFYRRNIDTRCMSPYSSKILKYPGRPTSDFKWQD